MTSSKLSKKEKAKELLKFLLEEIELKLLILIALIGFILKYIGELLVNFGIISEYSFKNEHLFSTFFLLLILLSLFELRKYNEIETNFKSINESISEINKDMEMVVGPNRLAYDLGLKAIHTSIGDESFFQRLDSANTLDIMSNTAKTLIHKYSWKIEHAIATRGCKVRILVSNPENTFWNNEDVRKGLCPGIDIKGEINDIITMLKINVENLKKHEPSLKAGSLEVKVYSNVPTCSIVIINNEILRHAPYLPFSHSTHVPIYDITNERTGELFNFYKNTFNNVWEEPTNKTELKLEFTL